VPKNRILDILRLKSRIKKIKTQSELKENISKIEGTKKLETDLDFNIEETIEIGVEHFGYRLKVNSQLRQNMMAQKEIVENRLEFLSVQQTQLQKLVQNEQIKTKKISEKYKEFNERSEIETELKHLNNIPTQRKV
tara:strand:+ start:476 stop:883 length:408 start_codon:yes stop_codon:yes gene_type:complete